MTLTATLGEMVQESRCGWTDAHFQQCTLPVDHEGLCVFETVHPTTGQALVKRPRARLVRGPMFRRNGEPATYNWVQHQALKLHEKGRSPEHIAKVFAANKLTRGDGSPVTSEDVKGWIE